MRAFVAVRIDREMVAKIREAQSGLERRLNGIRWVAGDNLHLTLKFLGSVAEEKIAPVAGALERAAGLVPRFAIAGRGIGVFPDIRTPKVIWAGLESKELEALARAVESALEPIGFPPEKRDFKPHLTIGRWRAPGREGESLKREIERWKNYDFGVSRVEEVVLFRSILTPDGAVHSPLHVVSLSGK